MSSGVGFLFQRIGAKVVHPRASGLSAYSSEINKSVLLNQKFSKGHPYTRALLLLLAQKLPRDLTNGTKVDLGEALSAYNRKEYHHLFPAAFLRKRGTASDKISNTCNFCFLPSASNKRISQKEPADYIFTLTPEGARKEILESNLMPLRMETYSNNDFDAFIGQRAELIVQYFDSIVI